MRTGKKIILLIILAVAVLCLTSCTIKNRNEEPISVNIWHVYGAQTDSPLNDLIDEFNATVGKDKGIKVEVGMVSNNKNIYKDISAAANDDPGAPRLPDIFVAYPKTVMSLPDENILVDYKDYLTQSELDEFIPVFLQDGVINGRLTVLPVAKSTELLFINKTAFDRYALATNADINALNTWEGLFETACDYARWTDAKTPDIANDQQALFVHDFHFNYFQVGVESLGEDFFNGDKLNFSDTFKKVWQPYAKATISGGVWIQGGYATEPLRTGESIVSVASSASVLYYSNQVTYLDNTSEDIEMISLPCPVFSDGEKLVMQRGAGMCLVKSTPEKEKAAVEFLKWLTEANCNTRFATAAGYMPVTEKAFNDYLPQAVNGLTEEKYIQLYKSFMDTQQDYEFYLPPQVKDYETIEEKFETNVRLCLSDAREKYVAQGGNDPQLLQQLVDDSYNRFVDMMK